MPSWTWDRGEPATPRISLVAVSDDDDETMFHNDPDDEYGFENSESCRSPPSSHDLLDYAVDNTNYFVHHEQWSEVERNFLISSERLAEIEREHGRIIDDDMSEFAFTTRRALLDQLDRVRTFELLNADATSPVSYVTCSSHDASTECQK